MLSDAARAHGRNAVLVGAVLVVLSLVNAFHATRAHAQRRSLARPVATPSAHDHFAAGAALFEEGNHEGAIAELEQSYELDPQPLVRLNIAQCYRELQRYDDAVSEYRRYLDAAGARVSPERRAEVTQTITALEAQIADVTLVVDPPGAEIRIDGREIGWAPLPGPLRLSAGRRVLEVTADQYHALHDDIIVTGGEARSIDVHLAPLDTAATLRITAAIPTGAVLRVDGLDVGAAPVERSLPSGGHLIEAHLDGYDEFSQALTLAPRQVLDLQVALHEHSGRGIVDEWWFWASISAVVVAAIILGVVFAPAAQLPPVPGNATTMNSTPGIVSALSWP